VNAHKIVTITGAHVGLTRKFFVQIGSAILWEMDAMNWRPSFPDLASVVMRVAAKGSCVLDRHCGQCRTPRD
jgi:hypothetical protein